MKKSTAQFLSVLFHIFVLICFVLLYDAGKAVVTKFGWIEGAADEMENATLVDFSEKDEELDTEIDAELVKYIDKTGEGYVFRTDGPFPKRLKVLVTEITRFNDVVLAERVGDKSANTKLTTRMEEIMEYEIAGNAVRFIKRQELAHRKKTASERVERLKVLAEAKEKGVEPPPDPDVKIGELVGKAVQFDLTNGEWKSKPTGEFKTMAWGKSLEEEVGGILVRNGLHPKGRWFGGKRLPVGHKMKLSGGGLDLVFEDVARGELGMEFKAVEGVHGHPCAAFDISGSVELKETTDDEGRKVKGEETIEGGRIWFSLLYPVVLRVEMDKIVSYETRENGKLVQQFQGKTTFHRHIDWKLVTAASKKPEKAEK